MDLFSNNSVYIYFLLMSFTVLWKTVVHSFWALNLNTFRKLHTDEILRTSSHSMHIFMAAMVVAMLLLH